MILSKFFLPNVASISNPYRQSILFRNPKYASAGNFMTLSEFLAFTKNTSVSGVLISIEVSLFLLDHYLCVLNYCIHKIYVCQIVDKNKPSAAVTSIP